MWIATGWGTRRSTNGMRLEGPTPAAGIGVRAMSAVHLARATAPESRSCSPPPQARSSAIGRSSSRRRGGGPRSSRQLKRRRFSMPASTCGTGCCSRRCSTLGAARELARAAPAPRSPPADRHATGPARSAPSDPRLRRSGVARSPSDRSRHRPPNAGPPPGNAASGLFSGPPRPRRRVTPGNCYPARYKADYVTDSAAR
jgi:hypothetical protein